MSLRASESRPVILEGSADKPKRKPQEVQRYRWCFTLKQGDISESQVSQALAPWCKEFYYQLEKSDGVTKYEHYQGCFSLNTKERLSTLKNMIGFDTIHLEPARNWFASVNYCKKNNTRLRGPWDHKTKWIKTISKDKFYPWQADMNKIIESEPDDRTVFWLYETTGNVGKTAFCKYEAVHNKATVLSNAASKDLAYAIDEGVKTVLFNFTREVEGRLNYSAIEGIKDGLLFSAKYESKMKVFDAPHIICLANFPPKASALSLDRWKIYQIKDKELVPIDCNKLIELDEL